MISNTTEPSKASVSPDKVPFWALFGTSAFKFFASLKLAIFLLATLMIVLAAGTILESLEGAEAAKLIIYDSPAFQVLLILLALNLMTSAFDRLPWKVKHIGFVLTHLGIILILAGSFITQRTMIDGQMAIGEGETEHRITLSNPLLVVFSEENHREWIFPLKPKPFAWKGKEPIGSVKPKPGAEPVNLWVLQNYPKAKIKENIIPAESAGKPAVQVAIHNSFVHETQWLIQDDETLGTVQVGPAKMVFTAEKLIESQSPEKETGNYLELIFDQNKTVQLPLAKDLKLPAVFPVAGTDLKITVGRIFKNAVVEGRELIEEPKADPKEEKNPAIQFTLEGKELSEKHTAFAKFPEFPTVHGMKPSAAGVKIFYRLPGGGSKGQSHELRFVLVPGSNELLYQIQTGANVKTGKVKEGEEVPTGWMGLVFQVKTFYPSARVEKEFSPEPNSSKDESAFPALQILAERGGESQTFWVSQSEGVISEIGGGHYQFVYGQKLIPAGFKLQLKDFKMETYPGTERPASFSSDVTLKDDTHSTVKNVTISMNQPLVYRGFHIYQSGYRVSEGQPDISIFAVGRDPGVPWKYAGAIVMVIGIMIMFYTRRFSTGGKTL